jgi:trimethylamine:corrinoid methyltransferase-like protein
MTEPVSHDVAPGAQTALERQPLAPLHSDFALSMHTPQQLERLATAAFEILERTGVKVLSPDTLRLLAERGAVVDGARRTARLPAELSSRALATAPRSFWFGSRDGTCDLDLGSGFSYGTTDGCGIEVIDWMTGERRLSTKADVAEVTRMQDYLGSICFWWPTVGAGDCAETAQLHELDAGWNNTVKHLQGMVQGRRHAQYAVAMAEAIAGDREALRARPVMSDLIGTVSPLVLDRDGIEAALVFAEAGVPVCFVSMPTLGTTAPATKAGAYALGLAEVIAGAVVLQLAHPGAPVLGAIFQVYADPRTGSTVSFPLDSRGLFLPTELTHHVGLPAMAGYGGTDAVASDSWQSTMEELHPLTFAALDRAETFTAIGLSKTYTLFSPEKMVLDDELYHRVRYGVLDIPIDDDELALEVVDDVGPGGHYLAHRHTRAHMPAAMTRGLAHELEPMGRYRDPLEVARERGIEILQRYRPEPLADDKRRELTAILEAADRELRS